MRRLKCKGEGSTRESRGFALDTSPYRRVSIRDAGYLSTWPEFSLATDRIRVVGKGEENLLGGSRDLLEISLGRERRFYGAGNEEITRWYFLETLACFTTQMPAAEN